MKWFVLFLIAFFMSLKVNLAIPLQRITEAVRYAKSGDTIFIDNGIYNNIRVYLETDKDICIMPVSLGGVVLTGKSQVIIKNSSRLKIGGFLFREVKATDLIILSNSHHINVFENYFYSCGSSPTAGSVIKIQNGSSDNLIYNNVFDRNLTLGIVIMTSRTNPSDKNNVNNQIFNNIFCNTPRVLDVYSKKGNNGMEAIQLGAGGAAGRWWNLNTNIYNNLFENITGDELEIISVKSSGNVICNNVFLNNKSGITIRYGNNNIIRENFLLDTEKGIRVYGSGHIIERNFIMGGNVGISLPSADLPTGESLEKIAVYYQADSILIRDNTFFNQGATSILFGYGFNKNQKYLPQRIKVASNVFQSKDAAESVRTDRALNVPLNQIAEILDNESHPLIDNKEMSVSVRDRAKQAEASIQHIELDSQGAFRSVKPKGIGTSWKQPTH